MSIEISCVIQWLSQQPSPEYQQNILKYRYIKQRIKNLIQKRSEISYVRNIEIQIFFLKSGCYFYFNLKQEAIHKACSS